MKRPGAHDDSSAAAPDRSHGGLTGVTRSSGGIAPDRLEFSTARLAALAAVTALATGMAVMLVSGDGRSPTASFVGGAIAATLGVLGLRSIPLRSVVRGLLALGAVIAWFFGQVNAGSGTSADLMVWVLASAAALVLSSSGRRSNRSSGVAHAAIVVMALVAGCALVLGPVLSQYFDESGAQRRPGDNGTGARSSAMIASTELDMTKRPRLTDAVVMTVEADRPSFWRAQTFDTWDGTKWTVGDANPKLIPKSGVVTPAVFDPAPAGGIELRQEYHLLGGYATALPAAPSAVKATLPFDGLQLTDGTLLSLDPVGPGTRYSVVSRQLPVTEAALRTAPASAGDSAVVRRFGATPVATARVRKLATEITAGATTQFEKVRAIEDWMAGHTTYSLDAPLSPTGSDVVDNFLFESRQGWCEQISSSLVVLARLNHVPTRLVSGFVSGEYDPVSRRYQVRERDAHAWAEVYFEGLGWVPFDPTAEVPLSGESASNSAVGDWLSQNGGWLLLAIGLVLALGPLALRGVRRVAIVVRRLARRLGGRGAAEGAAGVLSDEAELEASIERIGAIWGRPRSAPETATTFAAELAERTGVADLGAIGALIDRSRFGPSQATDAEFDDARVLVDAVLEAGPDGLVAAGAGDAAGGA